MKVTVRKRSAGFTLMEVMAVMAIIAILAAMVVNGMGYVKDKQNNEQAKVQIALLSNALQEYKLDKGSFPASSGDDGLSTVSRAGDPARGTNLLQILYQDGVGTAGTAPISKVYLSELDPRSNKQGWTDPTATTIRDPWGNPYRYRTPLNATGAQNAATQNPDFDLWSMGKNGLTNSSVPAGPDNKDDIKN